MTNYSPVIRPMPPIPIDTVCDAPLVCVSFSAAFIPYLLGLLEIYRWEESFSSEQEKSAGLFRDLMEELAMSCGCDCNVSVVVQTRITLTGRLEISTDGGETWKPDPNDPINSIPLLPPPVTSGVSANKCDAASNGKQHIQDLIAGISANLDTALSVFDLAVSIAGLALEIAIVIITGGEAAWELAPQIIALVGLIWSGARALFELGKTGFDAYWTTDETDKILCALYCSIGEDGQFTDAQFEAFMSRWIADATPSIAFNMLTSAIRGIGAKGLSQYCSYGESADSDCSACECHCDLSLWEVRRGTLVSQSATEIVIDAEDIEGSSVIEVKSNDIATGCKLSASITGDGSPVNNWNLPGEAYPGDWNNATPLNHTGIYGAGTCPNALVIFGFSGGLIGRVTITTEGDCD